MEQHHYIIKDRCAILTIPAGRHSLAPFSIPQTPEIDSWKIIAGKNSKITLYEEQLQSSELILEEGAQVDLVSLSTSPEMRLPNTQTAILHSHAKLTIFTALFSSSTLNARAQCIGNSAEYTHRILYKGIDRSHIMMNMQAEHAAKNTRSTTIVHGIALDRSHIEFAGNIIVSKDGSTHGSLLEHEGLLMSKQARIDALPGLTVHTNDVKAAHSSAVHYIRPDQLFYLQTRGLTKTAAEEMIISGFIDSMISSIHNDTLQNEIATAAKH